jgi:hypothetical protein
MRFGEAYSRGMTGKGMTETWESQVQPSSCHQYSCQMPGRRRPLHTHEGRNIDGKKMNTFSPDFPAINYLASIPCNRFDPVRAHE